jgi:hypothetical protein
MTGLEVLIGDSIGDARWTSIRGSYGQAAASCAAGAGKVTGASLLRIGGGEDTGLRAPAAETSLAGHDDRRGD